jgi:hypothetical protein
MKSKPTAPGWGLLLMLGGLLGVVAAFPFVSGCPSAGAPGGGQPAPECQTDEDCDNRIFCDGAETCVDEECVDGDPPCTEDEVCNEDDGVCTTACEEDADCDDDDLCTVDACVTLDPDTPGGTCLYTAVECDEGFECDPDTGECVVAGDVCDPACAEDEVCVAGECLVADPFEGVLARFESGELHDLTMGGHVEGFDGTCEDCHHTEPNAAALGCDNCHGEVAAFDDDLGVVVPSFKDLGHAGRPGDETTGNTACGACHQETTADGLWDCSHCHAEL